MVFNTFTNSRKKLYKVIVAIYVINNTDNVKISHNEIH